jgi:hypothetical protein
MLDSVVDFYVEVLPTVFHFAIYASTTTCFNMWCYLRTNCKTIQTKKSNQIRVSIILSRLTDGLSIVPLSSSTLGSVILGFFRLLKKYFNAFHAWFTDLFYWFSTELLMCFFI